VADAPEIDAELREAVNNLSASIRETRELYRGVASMMFFRFRLVPTANRMHQLVGRGSMTTASTALARFWQDVRRAARPTIDHPDLPPELQRRAGELVATLWSLAHTAAAGQGTFPDRSAPASSTATGTLGVGPAPEELARELLSIRATLAPRRGRGSG